MTKQTLREAIAGDGFGCESVWNSLVLGTLVEVGPDAFQATAAADVVVVYSQGRACALLDDTWVGTGLMTRTVLTLPMLRLAQSVDQQTTSLRMTKSHAARVLLVSREAFCQAHMK